MKIKITRGRLSDALKRVSGISDGRSLPILANVKVEAKKDGLTLTTTNLDITLVTSVGECEVIEPGVTTIPMKKLEQIVSVLPSEDVSIDTDEKEHTRIVSGGVKMSVIGLPAANFPELAEEKSPIVYKTKGATLIQVLRKTSYAMSKDDTRKTLQSVLLEFNGKTLKGVGTDGRRLGLAELDCPADGASDEPKQYVVPAYAVSVIQRLVESESDIIMKAEPTHLFIAQCDGRDCIYTRLVDGMYPNYKQVIPERGDADIKVDRNEMLAMLNRSLVMASSNEPYVSMKFVPGTIETTAQSDDGGKAHETIEAKYEGPEFSLMFNPRYLMDVLKSLDSDTVIINTDSATPHRPIAFTGETETSSLAIVMPLRVA